MTENFTPVGKLEDALGCPECITKGRSGRLLKGVSLYRCGECGQVFPIQDGVAFFFKRDKLSKLYPEIHRLAESLHTMPMVG